MSDLKEHQAVLLELLEEFDRICKKYEISYQVFAGTALGAVRHSGFIPWDDDLDIVMLRPEYERFLKVAPTEIIELYYVQSEFSEHWHFHASKLRKNNTACLEKYHPKDPAVHQGIYIDIFPCDNASNSKVVSKLQYFASRIVIAKTLYRRGYETDSILKKAFMACCRLMPLHVFHNAAMGRNQRDSQWVHTFFGGTSRYEKGIYPRKWFEETTEIPFEHMMVPISRHYEDLLTILYGDYMCVPSEEERKCKVHAILVDTERSYREYVNYRDNMKFDVYSRSIR